MPYLGEVMLFAGLWEVEGWAVCDGRKMSVRDNQALFSIIGNSYGGDGREFFHLPDLRSRVVVQPPMLTQIGAVGGAGQPIHVAITTDPAVKHVAATTGDPTLPEFRIHPRSLAMNYMICIEGGDYPPRRD